MPRPRRPGRAQAVPPVRCTRTLLLLIACTTAVTLTAFLTTLGSSMGGGDGSGGGGGPVRTVAAFRRAGIATARARRSLLYATGKGLGAADSGTSGRTVNAASAKARGKDGGGETTQPGRSEPGGSEAQSQQQQTGRSGLPTIPALLSEARDAADLLFGRVLPGSAAALSGTGAGAPAAARSSVPPELQVPEARELLDLLRRVWGAHTSPDGDVSPAQVSAAAGSGSSAKRQRAQWIRADGDNRESAPQQHGPAKGSEHCSTAAGGALLLRAAQAARGLQRLACGATDTAAHGVGVGGGDVSGGSAAAPAPPALALPFVALRRATLAAVQLVYETQAAMPGGAAARACLAAIDQAAPQLLRPFAGALNCSRAARPALELLHISKCGGTSMCKLAAAAGLSNPAANLDFNCMVTAFNDGPKWTLKDPLVEMEGFWPAVDCPAWASEPRMGCRARASELVATGTNFYSNELTLHEVSSDSFLDASAPGAQAAGGAAAAVGACPELETLLLLRDPVERARSHVVEVAKVYGGYPNLDKAFAAHRDLRHWQSWAPAVLDNFMTRYLLGRQYLCRAFGTLTERDLQSASLTLASLDHVLLLEEGELNDVALGAGLGWSQSLGQQR